MIFSLELPRPYRDREVLAFHARDPEALAERVESGRIRKGFVIEGSAVVLEISLQGVRAECLVQADGRLSAAASAALPGVARNMLGLVIDPRPFEKAVRADALLGALVRKQAGLRIPQTATRFEALTWAIIGQQINVAFALSLRRSLIVLAGQRHSSGLWCYPDSASVARLDPEALAQQRFSRAKAGALLRVAQEVESGALPLARWQGQSASEIGTVLLAIKGVGPWTVNYTLLRGFGFSDCSLHGDSAVRASLQRLAGDTTKLDVARAQALLERYQPYRSLAAAHLWASKYEVVSSEFPGASTGDPPFIETSGPPGGNLHDRSRS